MEPKEWKVTVLPAATREDALKRGQVEPNTVRAVKRSLDLSADIHGHATDVVEPFTGGGIRVERKRNFWKDIWPFPYDPCPRDMEYTYPSKSQYKGTGIGSLFGVSPQYVAEGGHWLRPDGYPEKAEQLDENWWHVKVRTRKPPTKGRGVHVDGFTFLSDRDVARDPAAHGMTTDKEEKSPTTLAPIDLGLPVEEVQRLLSTGGNKLSAEDALRDGLDQKLVPLARQMTHREFGEMYDIPVKANGTCQALYRALKRAAERQDDSDEVAPLLGDNARNKYGMLHWAAA